MEAAHPAAEPRAERAGAVTECTRWSTGSRDGANTSGSGRHSSGVCAHPQPRCTTCWRRRRVGEGAPSPGTTPWRFRKGGGLLGDRVAIAGRREQDLVWHSCVRNDSGLAAAVSAMANPLHMSTVGPGGERKASREWCTGTPLPSSCTTTNMAGSATTTSNMAEACSGGACDCFTPSTSPDTHSEGQHSHDRGQNIHATGAHVRSSWTHVATGRVSCMRNQ